MYPQKSYSVMDLRHIVRLYDNDFVLLSKLKVSNDFYNNIAG